MHISEHFNLPAGHANFDFVDVDTSTDTELFIDPCQIEIGNDAFCERCHEIISDYFDSFYNLYRHNSNHAEKAALFSHAHEINATKLGYGRGDNGKAKTADGMIATFSGVKQLIQRNFPLSKAIDLPIFISDFAEDCLSDMLTNILFKELSEYTLEQCRIYSIPVADVLEKYYYWDIDTHSWQQYVGKGVYINDALILLVPKRFVRHSYYYDVNQYFHQIILTKKKQERTVYDHRGKEHSPPKKDIEKEILRSHGNILSASEFETANDPTLLDEHHQKMSYAYSKHQLDDSELDKWTYKS